MSATGAVLFAVHPVHAEGVASLVGRADALSCFCFVLAVSCTVLANGRRSCLVEQKAVEHGTFWQIGILILSIVFAFAASLAKETGITGESILLLC